MSTVLEIESALRELPLHEVQKVAQWLQSYVEQQTTASQSGATTAELRLPDYAARRRMILGNKVLPNLVVLGREEERW